MPQIRLVALPVAALDALIDGDAAAASAVAGVQLGDWFVGENWLWRIRRDQIAADPASAGWIVRAAVAASGEAVGHGGFHRPPDAAGMVEVGYSVDPVHRRRGYATAILTDLLDRAAAEPAVHVVRASIRPDNTGSLATIARFGFVKVGEQWDPEDGLEIVYERPANSTTSGR